MLVGRDNEWDFLSRALEESSEGNGQTVLVIGGLASGKTSLLHRFSDHVVDKGAWLFGASASQSEGSLRMGVVGQLLQSPVNFPNEAEYQDAMAAMEAARADPDVPETAAISEAEAVVAQRMQTLMLSMCASAPVVLAIDDLQFADAASVRVLVYLMRRMRSTCVLLIVTECSLQQSDRPSATAELLKGSEHFVKLEPLSRAAVADELEQRLVGVDAPSAAYTRIVGEGAQRGVAAHELTGGKPLLVRALARELEWGAVGDDHELVFGQNLAVSVLLCLHHWGDPFLTVSEALAILGPDVSTELVGDLLGVQVERVACVVNMLNDAGVLVGTSFRSSAVPARLLEGLSPSRRARIHQSAAELLHQRGACSREIGVHLVAADDATPEWAVRTLRDAAEQALNLDENELASQMLDLAFRACTDERERLAITAARATANWRFNPAAALRAAPLQHVLSQEHLVIGDLVLRDAVTVVRYLLWRGDRERCAEVLTFMHESSNAVDPKTVAELDLAYQCVYGNWRGPGPDPVPRRRTPASTNPWTRAAAVLNAAPRRRRRSDDVIANAEQILRNCGLGDTTLESVITALLNLSHADKVDIAIHWCDALVDEGMRRGAPTWQAVLSSVRAELAFKRGDLSMSRELASVALELLPAQGWGVLIGLPLSTLLSAETAMGRYDAASEVRQHVVPAAMSDTMFGLLYLRACGQYHLQSGRVLAAYSDFQMCGKLMSQWDVDSPSMVPWRTDLAEACLKLDRPREAHELAAEQLNRTAPDSPRTRGISLRVLAASSDLRKRPELLREAVTQLQTSQDRLELARALADLSQAHHDNGDVSQARMTAHRAAQVGNECPAVMSTLQRIQPAVDPHNEEIEAAVEVLVLSDAERRVVRLAAFGHTNREIGTKLYVTPSTVEQHLTRAYRKLKVNGRKELRDALL